VDIILDHNANHLYVRYFVSHCTPTQLHLRGYKRKMINSQGHRIGEEEAGVGLHVDTTAHFVTLPPIVGTCESAVFPFKSNTNRIESNDLNSNRISNRIGRI